MCVYLYAIITIITYKYDYLKIKTKSQHMPEDFFGFFFFSGGIGRLDLGLWLLGSALPLSLEPFCQLFFASLVHEPPICASSGSKDARCTLLCPATGRDGSHKLFS